MDNKGFVVITSVGTDRPGIVEEMSGWLLENGGNIEDSRMSLLGGEFATLLLASGDSHLFDRLEASRAAMESRSGLQVFLKAVSAGPAIPAVPVLRYRLQATSLDHPGIVHTVSQLLRRHGINIVSAETRTTPAPFSGAPVFQFQMDVDIPAPVGVQALRDELRVLGNQSNIDFQLTAAQ